MTRLSTASLRKAIGALEVTSGLLAFAFISSAGARYGLGLNLFTLVSFGFAGLCVAAGIDLWRAQRRGLRLSVLAQVPQLLTLGTPRFGYKVQAGLQALITFRPPNAGLWFGLATEVVLGPSKRDPLFLEINLVPIIVLLLLWYLRRRWQPTPPAKHEASALRAA